MPQSPLRAVFLRLAAQKLTKFLACGRARCRQRTLLLESHDSQEAMRKLHLTAGLLGILVFVLSGQAMRLHKPPVRSLADGQRMMFLSRHIYILGSALVNLTLGLYLRLENRGWRRNLQVAGSLLIILSLVLLTLAFVDEPGAGIAGRSLQSAFGWFALFLGGLAHFFANVGTAPN